MKAIVATVMFFIVAPAFANCLALLQSPVDVFASVDPKESDRLRIKTFTLDGQFVGSFESGSRTFPVTDGAVNSTGSDTCSFEFTVKGDLMPGVRYTGTARWVGRRYLIAGTYHLPSTRKAGLPPFHGAADAPTYPFYIRGEVTLVPGGK